MRPLFTSYFYMHWYDNEFKDVVMRNNKYYSGSINIRELFKKKGLYLTIFKEYSKQWDVYDKENSRGYRDTFLDQLPE